MFRLLKPLTAARMKCGKFPLVAVTKRVSVKKYV